MSNTLQINSEQRSARAIAYYLPQFHPIPENDEWWGKGFTEWTNVTKAKPLFKGHVQPHLPADLGFYDLRVPEARVAQAELAQKYGIEGFSYWHYWFGNGRRVLERPFNEVLKSGEPNFPFCLGWANETWTGVWHGNPRTILMEQIYPGKEDYAAHFYTVLPAFQDQRYIKIKGKPVFLVYRPENLPSAIEFTDYWQELAQKEGLPGIYFVGFAENELWNYKQDGFEAFTLHTLGDILRRIPNSIIDNILIKLTTKNSKEFLRYFLSIPRTYSYRQIVQYAFPKVSPDKKFFPSVIPNWDNTPRSGLKGIVFQGSTPELFRTKLTNALALVANNEPEEKIIFLKSWNEWAEGNYLEPDREFGHAYLEAVSEILSNSNLRVNVKAYV